MTTPSEVLRNRPEVVVRLYGSVETFVTSLGPVEIVARERYVLFRSKRIFADLVIMTDAVRVAVHLRRKLDDPIFFKIVSDDRKVTHVAKDEGDRDMLSNTCATVWTTPDFVVSGALATVHAASDIAAAIVAAARNRIEPRPSFRRCACHERS